MREVHYQFQITKKKDGDVLVTYIGLTEIIRDELIAHCYVQDDCVYKSIERKGYRNWYLQFPDILFLDLLHHELIRDRQFRVTIGDPDSDYYQSTEQANYPKSLGDDYGFLERIGDEMTNEFTNYIEKLGECEDKTTSLIVKWDYKKDQIKIKIKSKPNPYE